LPYTSSQVSIFSGDAPKPWKIDSPYWNQKRERFECKVWYSDQKKPSIIPFDDLPQPVSLQGINFVKGDDRATFDITHVIELARKAKDKFHSVGIDEQRKLSLDIQAANFAWRCLKERHPAHAALLQDPVVLEIQKRFDAHVELYVEDFKK